uniref:Uncharacterized protein n=1 Tax=Romanomermis culicivorax TaxID=13658 RepID=A0A915K6Y4_ROMCU
GKSELRTSNERPKREKPKLHGNPTADTAENLVKDKKNLDFRQMLRRNFKDKLIKSRDETFKMGFYIIAYALGIYQLNLFIAFLTPKIDPALDFESGRSQSIVASHLHFYLIQDYPLE